MQIEIYKDEDQYILIINNVLIGTMPEEEILEIIKNNMEVI